MFVFLNILNEDGIFMLDDQIKDNMLLFVFVGYDISSFVLVGLFKYLFFNLECLKKVFEGGLDI